MLSRGRHCSINCTHLVITWAVYLMDIQISSDVFTKDVNVNSFTTDKIRVTVVRKVANV